MNKLKIYIKLISFSRTIVLVSGVSFILLLAISFTSVPYWGIYNLAVSESNFNFDPDVIVVMGGGGMPSQSALIRTYYAAHISDVYPDASIIIALPSEPNDSLGHLFKMKKELRIRGVHSNILYEPKGGNTRSQALNIRTILNQDLSKNILIVSSPEHMYRAIKSFKKVGFENVGGIPSFEKDIPDSLFIFQSDKLGGKVLVPDVGYSNQLRYQFWNHLKYEIILAREYTAILYYKLQSWI